MSKQKGQKERQPLCFRGNAIELLKYQGGEAVLAGPSGTGKAQPLESIVYTPTGPKRMGDVQVGDIVCHPDGGTSTVVQVHPQGVQPVWKITFSTGDSVCCTDDHLWAVNHRGGSKKKICTISEVLPLSEIRRSYRRSHGTSKYWIDVPNQIHFDPRPVPIDPYALGLILGDGSTVSGNITFTTADQELVDGLRNAVAPDYSLVENGEKLQWRLKPTRKLRKATSRKPGYVNWHPTAKKWSVWLRRPGDKLEYYGLYENKSEGQEVVRLHGDQIRQEESAIGETFAAHLRRFGLMKNRSHEKFIPDDYLYNSIDVRLAVLQGLMDTDGTVDKKTGSPSYCSTSQRMAENVRFLVESLGGLASITHKDPKKGKRAYQVWIRVNDPSIIFRLSRKKVRTKVKTKYPARRFVKSIDKDGMLPCQCITIDRQDGLYLTDHCVVTHNSMACIFKLHALCESKPGVRCLMIRKTRSSLTNSAMVTYEDKILPPNHPVLRKGGTRRMRSEYEYPNGSVIVLGGMDDPIKVMSTEYDCTYVQEAIELRENEWDSLSSRLRNGMMPYQQLFADTNPDHPQHWLKQRCDRGDTLLLESKHEDNPGFWDIEKKQWTPAGAAYIARLDKLRGPVNERLRWGRWSSAEGAIYADWRRDKHVVSRREIPPEWPRFWAVDFGYHDPFVCLMAAVDPEDRLIVYRELYKSKTLVEVHAKVMLALLEREATYWAQKRNVPIHSMQRLLHPRAIICDHQASERATLEAHLGLPTVPAKKGILRGIQVVSERLIFQPDGRPRLEYMDDSLVSRDESLAAEGKPTTLLEEMPAYVWKPGVRDQPVDKDNHALDCLLYLCLYRDKGSSGLYEPPTYIETTQPSQAIVLPGGIRTSGTGRLRFGEQMDRERRGGRLFGGGR